MARCLPVGAALVESVEVDPRMLRAAEEEASPTYDGEQVGFIFGPSGSDGWSRARLKDTPTTKVIMELWQELGAHR